MELDKLISQTNNNSTEEEEEEREKSPINVKVADFAYHKVYRNLTDTQVVMHIIKGSVGTGVLAMPAAIRDAGLLFGPLAIAVSALIITHSMQLLIQSCQIVRQVHDKKIKDSKFKTGSSNKNFREENNSESISDKHWSWEPCLDYYETVRMSFLLAPDNCSLSRWSWLASVLNICLIIGQFGFLGVYQIFVAQNIQHIVADFQSIPSTSSEAKSSIWLYLFGVYAFLLPLVFVKGLHRLSFLSTLANSLGVGALLLIIVYCSQQIPSLSIYPLARGLDTFPLAFGVIVFAFEAINVLLPLENQMRNRENLLGPSTQRFSCLSSVIIFTMVIVSCLYIAVGFYGYLRFGDKVEGAITYNIPSTPWIYALVKPAYTLSVLISYTLQFYVLYSALCQPIVASFTLKRYSKRHLWLLDALLRIMLVTVAFLLAILVPNVELMISFFGSIAGAAVVLIFPPLIHSVHMWIQLGCTWNVNFCCIFIKNLFIIFYGVVGAGVGGGVSLLAIINNF